jgi:hypothetical protein
MKITALAAFVSLFLLSIVTPWSSFAEASGPSASGTYTFVLEDNFTKNLEFQAVTDERGTTTGHMTFRDDAGSVELDPDSGQEPPKDLPSVYITADLDTLSIENNRALMAGTIRDSSNSDYIGRWVQLVVEDNGDGSSDKLSWSFCKPEPGGWVPADAEDPRDDGAWWHWWATDAERRDDVGIASQNIIPGTRHGCTVSPLATYDFPDARGEGDIHVER